MASLADRLSIGLSEVTRERQGAPFLYQTNGVAVRLRLGFLTLFAQQQGAQIIPVYSDSPSHRYHQVYQPILPYFARCERTAKLESFQGCYRQHRIYSTIEIFLTLAPTL